MTMTTIVNSITLIESINSESNVYLAEFDNGTSAYWIAAPNDPQKFLNQEVEVQIKKDMYQGKVEDFVANIAEQRVVNTIRRGKTFKLFAENTDSKANIALKDIEIGDSKMNCIVYCTKMRYDASAKADWINLTVSDMFRRVGTLRIFSPDVRGVNYAGKYIKCDIRRNKYGLSTDAIYILDEEYSPNPELDLAEQYILDQFATDKNFSKFLDDTNILAYLRAHVGYEAGSLLLDAAVAIDIAQEMSNVTPGLNIDAIKQAFILDKSWALANADRYSKEFLTVYNSVKYKSLINSGVVSIIDNQSPIPAPEREIYKSIKALVRAVVKARKEIDPDEED